MGEWDYIPKQDIPKEKTEIINCILYRYIQDLQQRDDIIFEVSPTRVKPDDELNINNGIHFYPETKAYSINKKCYIVVTVIKGSDALIAGSDYRIGNECYMHVSIFEKAANGHDKRLAVCRKETCYDKGNNLQSSTSVYFDDVKLCYDISSSRGNYLLKEIPGQHSIQEFPETIDRVREFSKDMVEPEIVDKLFDLIKDKVKFQISSRVRKRPGEHMVKGGVVEVGSWPDEGLTNIGLEEMKELQRRGREELLDSMFKDQVVISENQTNKSK